MHFENCLDFQNECVSRSKSHCVLSCKPLDGRSSFNLCYQNDNRLQQKKANKELVFKGFEQIKMKFT